MEDKGKEDDSAGATSKKSGRARRFFHTIKSKFGRKKADPPSDKGDETHSKLSVRTLSFRQFVGRRPKEPRPSVYGILEQGDKAATTQGTTAAAQSE